MKSGVFHNFFDDFLFGSWFGSGQDPNTDPNAERTQWSGKHEKHGKDHFAMLRMRRRPGFCDARVFLSLFYFVLFYYPPSGEGESLQQMVSGTQLYGQERM